MQRHNKSPNTQPIIRRRKQLPKTQPIIRRRSKVCKVTVKYAKTTYVLTHTLSNPVCEPHWYRRPLKLREVHPDYHPFRIVASRTLASSGRRW